MGQPLNDDRIYGAAEPGGAERLYVTRPSLPPLAEFLPYLEQIWENQVVTNGGEFHRNFEAELQQRWNVEHVSLFTNGTLALVTALRALRVTGEVLTTPYSFAATPHAIAWNGLKPVFADVDPTTMNLDPASAEAAISNETTAILPVHCYGRPCDVDGIRRLADRHNLRVVYDAAHAFDVKYRGESLMRHGDLAVVSFHATKVFTTFEGGAIISSTAQQKAYIDTLKNFGIVDQTTILGAGINAKMSEFNAALGLVQLKHIDQAIAARGKIDSYYREHLADLTGIEIPQPSADYTPNFSYFPILIKPSFGMDRDAVYTKLVSQGVMVRRYFYPLVSDTVAHRGARVVPGGMPNAERLASEVLCLPIYPDMSEADLDRVVSAIFSLNGTHKQV